MMWFLLFLPLFSWSQDDIDLSAIQDLETLLPDHDIRQDAYRNIEFERKYRDFRPPVRKIELSEITLSGTTPAFLKKGTTIYRIKDNKPMVTTRDMYLRKFRVSDENEFHYLQNNDKSCTYRVHADNVTSIAETISLYEPPRRYTPADPNMVRTVFDKKLNLVPEAAVYVGIVQGSYIHDLFNDTKAKSGNMNQYGFHYFTEWKLPVKVGAAVHYERSSYGLSSGGNAFYEALSFGPQFRTADFDLFQTNWRLTTQIRVSPFAKIRSESAQGNVNFRFNSTDLLTTAEHPWGNRWGQFVIGAFHQMQWLNMKDQPRNVSVSSSNQTNQGFGLFLSQVFQ
jgi:hypothetical protein